VAPDSINEFGINTRARLSPAETSRLMAVKKSEKPTGIEIVLETVHVNVAHGLPPLPTEVEASNLMSLQLEIEFGPEIKGTGIKVTEGKPTFTLAPGGAGVQVSQLLNNFLSHQA